MGNIKEKVNIWVSKSIKWKFVNATGDLWFTFAANIVELSESKNGKLDAFRTNIEISMAVR